MKSFRWLGSLTTPHRGYFERMQPRLFPGAHTTITQTLLTFLAYDEFVNKSWFQADLPALLDYCQYCLVHAAGDPERQLGTMIMEFLGHAPRWKQTMGERWNSPPWNFTEWPSQPSSLWIAAATNLVETAKFLLDGKPLPEDSDSPEIGVASYYGHFHMVQLLLDKGADVNIPARPFGSALQAAVYAGHTQTVRLLINYGADVNAQGPYGTSLAIASFRGHEDIIRLLLMNGADVHARSDAALQAAVNGKVIARLLIDNAADADPVIHRNGEGQDSESQSTYDSARSTAYEHDGHLHSVSPDSGLNIVLKCSKPLIQGNENPAHDQHADMFTMMERLDKLFHDDKDSYAQFLAHRGSSAQWLLDLLQDLLDYDANLTTMNRRRLFKALIRVSRDSELLPRCFPLTDIDALQKDFGREALIWRQFSHPNLLPFYETYCADCLLSLILDVALGLEHLHDLGVVHGDLKGDNIFITPSRRACIADFGLSSIITSMSSIKFTNSSKPTQAVGHLWLRMSCIRAADRNGSIS
ncbi:Protein kinase domain-containing protein [Mycena venus]|uniref:Protein kinase domain-containing protein n=1 Tax=Mycena venus TaxID=2733690 RepID=A0A8H6YWY2_9AGAR|nr:Protein kinase domain-containing protein [Mycena venus]